MIPGLNIYPPLEEKRISNQSSMIAQLVLTRQFLKIFGRWPSIN